MDRFWAKVKKDPKDPEGCWEFVGRSGKLKGSSLKRGGGYAPFLFGGKVVDAHRVSWMLEHGEIPAGMCVCHHCDNTRCVRPDHLFLGTYAENVRDMLRKGRGVKARGTDHYLSKLTVEQVYVIRESYEKGDCSRLAREFGVAPCTIYNIRARKNWAWLPEKGETSLLPGF